MKIVKGSEMPFQAAAHEDPSRPGTLKRVLLAKDELFEGRVQMINWASMPAGASFRRHYHEDMEEIFVLLDGPAQFEVDGAVVDLVAGDAVVISPRERHQMRNFSDRAVQYLVVGISGTKGGKTVVVE